MSQLILELLPALLLATIVVVLWRVGRAQGHCDRPGWRLMVIGLTLVFLGMLFDTLKELPPFAHLDPLHLLAKWMIGEVLGLLLVTIGLARWLPSLSRPVDDPTANPVSEQRAPPEGESDVLRRELHLRASELRAARHRQEWLDTLLDALPDAVLFKDGGGRWQLANRAMLNLFQLQGVDYQGKSDLELAAYSSFHRLSLLACTESDERAWGAGTVSRALEQIPHPEEPDRLLDVIKVPTFHADGRRKGLVIVGRDITERKRAETELLHAKDAAESASRVRKQFLTTISHEIRTPMNAIIGMGELLLESGLNAEQRSYVETIETSGESLLGLINDILDLSKSEGERLELDQGELDLNRVVNKVLALLGPKAREKGLALTAEIHPEVPTSLVGDPRRLRQVLVNLVENAIKFTHAGSIELRVLPESAARYPGILRFSVRDSGIGIPEEKLEAIFSPFTQADATVTRRYGGAGLGLTISRRLVELMNGRLWADSQTGRGSTFHFTAHFGIRPAGKPRAEGEPRLADLKVLVIDNDATNRLIQREMLASMGALVRESGDCENGIGELARAHRKGDPYRLVVIDCEVTEQANVEGVRQLLAEHPFPDIRFIVVASRDQPGERGEARALDAGYLLKPIKREDLIKELHAVLQAPAEEPAVVPEGTPRTRRILLVEDSEDNQMLVQAYLKSTPHALEIARDGAEALEMFHQGDYDLVLMDVQMPVMDGYEATRRMREWEKAEGRRPTPVITLTAHAMKEDERQSYLAGCDAHLTKPIKKAKLLEAIERYAGGEAS
ncbi:response regulator [Endothiovibrio diazotrophicus]